MSYALHRVYRSVLQSYVNFNHSDLKIPPKDILFVLIQFIIFIVYTFDFESMRIDVPDFLFWFGVFIFVIGALITVVAVLQLNINLSAFPSPLADAKLIETGVYKFIRHPIYTGLILAFFGYAIVDDSGYKLLISLGLLLWFYFKTLYEERLLIEKFPQYSEYKKRSGRFFPKFWQERITTESQSSQSFYCFLRSTSTAFYPLPSTN